LANVLYLAVRRDSFTCGVDETCHLVDYVEHRAVALVPYESPTYTLFRDSRLNVTFERFGGKKNKKYPCTVAHSATPLSWLLTLPTDLLNSSASARYYAIFGCHGSRLSLSLPSVILNLSHTSNLFTPSQRWTFPVMPY
jgi:hypothetical protein